MPTPRRAATAVPLAECRPLLDTLAGLAADAADDVRAGRTWAAAQTLDRLAGDLATLAGTDVPAARTRRSA